MEPEPLTAPAPRLGQTYSLADADYRYGTGPLLVRVTEVVRQTQYGGEPWWEVEAMCKPPTSASPAYPRRLYVKASALSASGRPR